MRMKRSVCRSLMRSGSVRILITRETTENDALSLMDKESAAMEPGMRRQIFALDMERSCTPNRRVGMTVLQMAF